MLVRGTKFALASGLFVVAGSLLSSPSSYAADEAVATSTANFVDGIAAVVDEQVITLRQVDAEASSIAKQMQAQSIPLPPQEILRIQVLNRIIDDTLQQQQAEAVGLTLQEGEVENAVHTIAERNNLTVEQLRAELERTGVSWNDYLRTLRHDLLVDQLRQHFVDNRINISESEVDTLLRSQGMDSSAAPAASSVELAQILVRIPENADRNTIDQLRSKAEALRERVRGGEDFAGVAAAASEGPEALQGGVLGDRPTDAWPELFVKATENLRSGDISEVIRSGAGFHILKVVQRGSQQAGAQGAQDEMIVTQTHARHILVKLSQVRTDEQALARIRQVQARIQQGESFPDLARSYSEDSSAPQGGDLGWLNPGETVPAFEQAMDALAIGQVSEPVRSPFGWHLIVVDERRQQNMEHEFRRMQARQHLYQQRIEPAMEDWLNELRSSAYIDNRLEKAYRNQQQ